MSNNSVFANIQLPGNDANDGSLSGYTEFNGSTNDDLNYDEDNYMVSWELNSSSDSEHEIEIEYVNVKASNKYMRYDEGLLDGDRKHES